LVIAFGSYIHCLWTSTNICETVEYRRAYNLLNTSLFPNGEESWSIKDSEEFEYLSLVEIINRKLTNDEMNKLPLEAYRCVEKLDLKNPPLPNHSWKVFPNSCSWSGKVMTRSNGRKMKKSFQKILKRCPFEIWEKRRTKVNRNWTSQNGFSTHFTLLSRFYFDGVSYFENFKFCHQWERIL